MSTITYPDFYHPPKFVLEEEIDSSLFTGRKEILQRLWDWVLNIDRKLSSSIALMSPRRYGKSVVLARLFNVMYSSQDRVAPFYIRISEESWKKGDFADKYFLTFLKQFCAFFLRDDELLKAAELTGLHESLSRHSADWIPEAIRQIEVYQRIGQSFEYWDKKMHFAQNAPNELCAVTGKKCLVIIDEFQDMNRRLYLDDPKTLLEKIVTGAYRSLAESKIAPMLVAGSMLSMLSRIVFSGALYGRFGGMPLPLMPEAESEELMDKLAAAFEVKMIPATKKYLFALTKGNPYYITYMVDNSFTRDLAQKESPEEVYLKQTTMSTGRFYGLWRLHFTENMELLNDDQHGKRILYYIRLYPK